MNPEDRERDLAAPDESGRELGAEAGEDSVRELLREAFHDDGGAPTPDVLRGVQRKLRERSGGKFYADSWSTARHPPIAMYLVTSAVMLAIVLAAYLVLRPLAGEPVPVHNEPVPVRVIPRQR